MFFSHAGDTPFFLFLYFSFITGRVDDRNDARARFCPECIYARIYVCSSLYLTSSARRRYKDGATSQEVHGCCHLAGRTRAFVISPKVHGCYQLAGDTRASVTWQKIHGCCHLAEGTRAFVTSQELHEFCHLASRRYTSVIASPKVHERCHLAGGMRVFSHEGGPRAILPRRKVRERCHLAEGRRTFVTSQGVYEGVSRRF